MLLYLRLYFKDAGIFAQVLRILNQLSPSLVIFWRAGYAHLTFLLWTLDDVIWQYKHILCQLCKSSHACLTQNKPVMLYKKCWSFDFFSFCIHFYWCRFLQMFTFFHFSRVNQIQVYQSHDYSLLVAWMLQQLAWLLLLMMVQIIRHHRRYPVILLLWLVIWSSMC